MERGRSGQRGLSVTSPAPSAGRTDPTTTSTCERRPVCRVCQGGHAMGDAPDAQPTSNAQIDALVHESTRLRYSRRTILRRATALGLSAPAFASVLAEVQPAAAQSEPVTVTW